MKKYIRNVKLKDVKQNHGINWYVWSCHALFRTQSFTEYRTSSGINEELTSKKSLESQTESRQLYTDEQKYDSAEVKAQSKTFDAFRQKINRNRNDECEWFSNNRYNCYY